MKKGDPKTARLLIVVAIGAVGFVVIQVLPAKGQGGPISARPVEGAAANTTNVGLTSNVPNDSFSSPLLARVAAASRTDGQAETMKPMTPGSFGLLPTAGLGASTGFGPGPAQEQAPPRGDTGKQAPPKRTAVLSGIVSADSAVAFIAIDGKDSRGCRVGELVGPGIRLVAIDGSEAILRVGGRRTTLALGQVTEL